MHITIADIITAISLLVAIEMAIGHGTIALTNALPETWIPRVQAWCNILAGVGSLMITALSRYTGAAVIVFALILVGGAGHAQAQPKKIGGPIGHTLDKIQGQPAAAPSATAPAAPTFDPIGDLLARLEAVKQEIVTGAIADLTAADADAATLTNPNDTASFRDPISHACYPAQIKFLQSLPTAQPLQGDPKFQLVQIFQRKRDFVAQVKAGLPSYLKLGCSALLGDELQTFVSTIGLVGIKILPTALTGLFPAIAPVTLPALSLIP